MFEIDREGFPKKEEKTLGFWENEDIFQKCLSERREAPLFSYFDGPPFATGLPHYGHILTSTIKDTVHRYKTMQGYFVPRRFGWDCHGLPVENEIEKAHELSGAPSIEAFGIGKFNEECRSIVLRYSGEWKKTMDRMGRWIDFSKTYRTMDISYMESVWWVFSELWKQNLVYEGFKVMPFSTQLGTPLSNFEANLNYKDVDDPSVVIAFRSKEEKETYFLAWTTTPWTLVSNLALIVNPELEYVKVRNPQTGHCYILGKARLEAVMKDTPYEIVETFKGEALNKKPYEPLFDYYKKSASENAYHVYTDSFVGAEDGTGIVHGAPAFGEADFFVCKREGIELVNPIDQNGKFTKEIPELEGVYIKDADRQILKWLKEKKLVFNHSTVRHRYPFCWRSDTPLIYKAVRTWFVSVEKIKDKLLAANAQINWTPEHIKEGRFGKWLENARDWAVSRNRYWGTPIPIWRSEEGDFHVVSSIAELEGLTGEKINDLHRHFIDPLTFEKEGKIYSRIPEVFDCWFESGSMPYAQNHYPFENEKMTMDSFPADFIVEGLDQTRGWFYTLTVLAAALFDGPAFKNVIVNGIVLAEDGTKMSKRLKNYPEPSFVFDKYGADAVRLYLIHSPAVQGDDMRFAEKGVEMVLRQILIPFWNAYVFLATYANIYGWKPKQFEKEKPVADIDRWIMSQLQKLTETIERGMDKYVLSEAVEPFVSFIDKLTNWYIRRCRVRFWADEDTQDRQEAFKTLYTVMLALSKLAAPFVPFISETVYRQLRSGADPESVHLCAFPKAEPFFRDSVLEEQMENVMKLVSMGHSLRKESKIKVRQPLKLAHVAIADPAVLESIKQQSRLIEDELNVKGIKFYKDDSYFVTFSAKPNFKTLGRRYGKLMGDIKKHIDDFDSEKLSRFQKEKSLRLTIGEEIIDLEEDDILIERHVKEDLIAQHQDQMTIALDLHLDESLIEEGLAREIVNKVNTMRRDEDFDVTDRIRITIDTTEPVKNAFQAHMDYISGEVLAKEVLFEKCEGKEWELNAHPAVIKIERL